MIAYGYHQRINVLYTKEIIIIVDTTPIEMCRAFCCTSYGCFVEFSSGPKHCVVS